MTLKKILQLGVASMFDKRYKENKGLSDYEILMHLANDFINIANKLADIQSREETCTQN